VNFEWSSNKEAKDWKIMRDVNNGWLIRYIHANVASFFFICVYAQIYNNFTNLFYYFNKLYINLYNKIIEDFISIFKPLINKNSITSKNKIYTENFMQWFVGFTDAEGTFLINIRNNKEVHFVFKITLHINDISVLYSIKNKLGIGIVSIEGKSCSFRIHSFQTIIDILIPIFDKYFLLTHKQLNFKDWKKAIILKFNSKKNNRSIDNITFKKILDIKNNMNNLRTNFDNYIITDNMISKYWLLGFVEGDGTFHFSNTSAIFGISQKDKKILEVISNFIENINLSPIYDNLIIPNKPNCIIKNNKGSYQLVITDIDVLFQYIYPFFKELGFYSRKGIDFKFWSLGLFLIVCGYYCLPKGKEFLIKLSNNMNSKRYFSNIFDIFDIEEIENIFNSNPPFDIFSGKSHFILAKEFALFKRSNKGFKLYIYKNGMKIEGSPFNSYRLGGRAIGLNSVSSIKNYIDTGKIFKNLYTFYSKPII
jgi:LAGLIDADG endonuclease/Cytochrome b/b6/petB